MALDMELPFPSKKQKGYSLKGKLKIQLILEQFQPKCSDTPKNNSS